MYGKVTLKESFLKRRISSYPKPADLTLSNGKVYDLSFILDEDIVEITNKKGEPIGKKLSQEERYAVIEDGEIIAKGLELVRRDWAPIVKKTQEAVLMAILKEGDSDKAIKEVKKAFKRIRSGKVDNKELVIHTQITKPLHQYKQVGPHVVAAQKIEEHGVKVSRGTIVRYIIVKGKGSISQRAVPYEYSEGFDYDKDYYIKNQLIPAVERIMYSFGYTRKDLEDMAVGEVQQSLDAFF